MKTVKLFFALFTLLFATTIHAQVAVNNEGNSCFGNDSCFWGFDGATASHSKIPHWTNVTSTTLNVGGGLSIAAMEEYMPAFSVTTPNKTNFGISISPFFYIDREATVYSKNGIVQSSDSTLKTNIIPLSSALSKLKNINGVSYDFKNEERDESVPENSLNRTVTRSEKTPRHIGLIAQEVEKVYPEVVCTLIDGSKGIKYADLVAVLIEGVKELNDSLNVISGKYNILQEQIDGLRIQLQSNKEAQDKYKHNLAGNNSKMSMDAVLYQNTPNPFKRNTEIGYRLFPDAQNASIGIYDLNGREVKMYSLNVNSMTGKIHLVASDFEPGIYIYALVIDKCVVDSKRMVIEILD